MNQNFSILIVMTLFLLNFTVVHFIRKTGKTHPEIPRKFLHITAGLICLTFPLFFVDRAPVIIIGLVSLITMIFLKTGLIFKSGIGKVLKGEGRQSSGDIYFPISIVILWMFFYNQVNFYITAVLILTFSDSLAAVIGTFYGKNKYKVFNSTKSLEGTFACFGSTFLIFLLMQIGNLSLNTYTLAFSVALAVSAAEAVSTKGFDNLSIPFTVGLVLYTGSSPLEKEITALGLFSVYTLIFIISERLVNHSLRFYKKGV